MKHDSIHLYMQAIKFQLLPECLLTQGHHKIKENEHVNK